MNQLVERLFSSNVLLRFSEPEMWDGNLYAEEQACIGHAAGKRQREFTAGRVCAREVLACHGIVNYPLLMGASREPLWPQGVVGSISHCEYCCVVVACNNESLLGLGVDVEPDTALEDDVMELVCTIRERAWLKSLSAAEAGHWAKIIFSAKESVYKCLFPMMKQFLDFRDLEIKFDETQNSFSMQLVNKALNSMMEPYCLSGRYGKAKGYLVTGVELRKSSAPASTRR